MSPRPPNLFPEPAATAAPPPTPSAPAPAVRPLGWRAPGERDHVCVYCAGLAVFGDGASWFCRSCVPASFFPRGRA
ncbi:MAG: hypothetical protein JWQ97_956 [Phenylobacterium sp.]|nr:hypothetical protein [Phenylobacterium sp.]